jgi:SAM-dependent methyltransferase
MKNEREPFVPSPGALECVIQSEAGIEPDEPGLLDWHRTYLENHRNRIALDLDIVKNNIIRDSSILEFGSIPLLLTASLVKSGYRLSGCDLAPERYGSAIDRLGLTMVKCNIETETLPFDSKTFDGVIFNELFEHLRINLIFTLREVHRVMKPGAVLLLSTPNLRSLNGLINFVLKNRSYSCAGNVYDEYSKLEKLGHMGHVREYTVKEVREFLGHIGFTVNRLIFRGSYDNPLKRSVLKVLPGLSPFVTYMAKKNG